MARGHECSSAAPVFNYRRWFTCHTCYKPTQMAQLKLTFFFFGWCWDHFCFISSSWLSKSSAACDQWCDLPPPHRASPSSDKLTLIHTMDRSCSCLRPKRWADTGGMVHRGKRGTCCISAALITSLTWFTPALFQLWHIKISALRDDRANKINSWWFWLSFVFHSVCGEVQELRLALSRSLDFSANIPPALVHKNVYLLSVNTCMFI